ncbi:hypothetical protein [Streptomyces sp. NPDC001889]
MTDTTPDRVRLAGEVARQIDQLAQHLTQVPIHEAVQIIATVLDPDDGALVRITTLVAAGSHYAESRAKSGDLPPEVWLELGLAANRLHDVALDIEEHTATLRQLAQRPTARGTALPPRAADGPAPGRGR